MRPFKHVETWGNGAHVLEPLHPAGPVPLTEDSLLVRGHKTYFISTTRGYRAEYGEIAPRSEREGWETHRAPSILGRGAVICAGEHPDKGKEFIKVELGMLVLLNNEYYWIDKHHPWDPDNLKLVPLSDEEVKKLHDMRRAAEEA